MKARISKYEFLRICSIVMIIMAHYVIHGGLMDNSIGLTQAFSCAVKPLGNLGVICFVLISARLGRTFHFQRVLKIYAQTVFVTLILYLPCAWGGIMTHIFGRCYVHR